jgi:hypothetical protein
MLHFFRPRFFFERRCQRRRTAPRWMIHTAGLPDVFLISSNQKSKFGKKF